MNRMLLIHFDHWSTAIDMNHNFRHDTSRNFEREYDQEHCIDYPLNQGNDE